jgi:hypothetical protein
MTGINLAHGDAIELTELLQFIDTWLANDHDQLNPSLHRFVGTPSYDTSRLRTTLARFIGTVPRTVFLARFAGFWFGGMGTVSNDRRDRESTEEERRSGPGAVA